MKKQIKSIVFILTVFFSATSVVFAGDAGMVSRINGLEKTMAEMQKLIERQNNKIMRLEGARVIRDEGDVVKAPKETPKWLDDLKFSGDFRLRYEARSEHGNANAPDRNRFRYRLRYGFEKKFKGPFHEDDVMKVGFRLASANAGARDSTNTTLDGQFDFDSISINRAYATYIPGWAKFTTDDGIGLTGMHVTAGKFKNPFRKGSTWMIWDSDIEPEGIYEQVEFKLLDTENFDLKNTTIFGQLIVDEDGSGGAHQDSEIYAYQTVFESKMGSEKPVKMKNAFSFYDYNDFGVDTNFGVAGGNSLKFGEASGATLERSFSVFNVYNELAFPFQLHKAKGWKVYFDWHKNVSGNGLDAAAAQRDHGWMIGTKLGKAKKKGTWELKYEYAWLDANASPDVFNDSDFGGTNRRGSVIKGAYALTDSLKFKSALFLTDRIDGNSSERDLWQFDLVWKF